MHKGLFYRQVLPPSFGERYQINGRPPMRLGIALRYRYAAGEIEIPSSDSVSEKAHTDIAGMGIVWRWTWSAVGRDFATIVTHRQFFARPDYDWTIATFDDVGSADITLWRLFDGGNWRVSYQRNRMLFVEERTFGLFDREIGWSFRAVPYSEEP